MIEVILLKVAVLAKLFLGFGKASVLWAGKATLLVLGLAATLVLLVIALAVGIAVALSLLFAGPSSRTSRTGPTRAKSTIKGSGHHYPKGLAKGFGN